MRLQRPLLLSFFFLLTNVGSTVLATTIYSPDKIICIDSKNHTAEVTISKNGNSKDPYSQTMHVAIQILDMPSEPFVFKQAKFDFSPRSDYGAMSILVLHDFNSETGTSLSFQLGPNPYGLTSLVASPNQPHLTPGDDFTLSISNKRSALVLQCLPFGGTSKIASKEGGLLVLASILRLEMALTSNSSPSEVILKLRSLDLNPGPITDGWLAGQAKRFGDSAKDISKLQPTPKNINFIKNKIYELSQLAGEFLRQEAGCQDIFPEGGLPPVYPIYCR